LLQPVQLHGFRHAFDLCHICFRLLSRRMTDAVLQSP
jgi:hypothetical protein